MSSSIIIIRLCELGEFNTGLLNSSLVMRRVLSHKRQGDGSGVGGALEGVGLSE